MYRLTITIFIIVLVLSKALAQTTRPPTPFMDNKMIREFLQTHLVYPEKSFQNKVQGSVEIAFTSDENGKVTTQKIISSVNTEIDTEALRLFGLIIWQPALKYGRPMSGDGIFSINFNIKKYSKTIKRRGYNKIELNYLIETSNRIYARKEVDSIAKPILPEGCQNLYTYVYKQMKYPQQAAELEVEGKVELTFIIETNGFPSNFIVNQTVGGGCTGEALRIVKNIRWQPAFEDGLAVRSKMTMFIEFRISEIRSGKHVPNQTNSGF